MLICMPIITRIYEEPFIKIVCVYINVHILNVKCLIHKINLLDWWVKCSYAIYFELFKPSNKLSIQLLVVRFIVSFIIN